MVAGSYLRDIQPHGHSQECHTLPKMAKHICPRHSNGRLAHFKCHISRATPSTMGQNSSQILWRAATEQGGRQDTCPQHHPNQGQIRLYSPTRGGDRGQGLLATQDPKRSPSKGATHMMITAKEREHIYNPTDLTAKAGESRYGMQTRQMICRPSYHRNMWQARQMPLKKRRLR